MKWGNVLPEVVAAQQQAWERRQAVFRAFVAGATYKEIGSAKRMSIEQVADMIDTAERELGHKSPLEKFLTVRASAKLVRVARGFGNDVAPLRHGPRLGD